MEIQLPNKVYNFDKLSTELGYPIRSEGDTIFIILPDGTGQAVIDGELAIASAHNPSATIEQLAISAKQSIAAELGFSKTYAPLLVASFNDPLQALSNADNLTLDTWYTAWRGTYEGWVTELGESFTDRLNNYSVGFIVPGSFSFDEPELLTDFYKVEFHHHINNFLQFITILSRFK